MSVHTHKRAHRCAEAAVWASSHSKAGLQSVENFIFNSVTRRHMETIKNSSQAHERMSVGVA